MALRRCPAFADGSSFVSSILLLLPLLPLLVAITSADCAPYPISAPIKDVVLSNNQKVRGVAMAVGTPPQNFAFLPQW